ncbi:helix-turn-helix transcriptional regulator [Streptomyces sp. NPDC048172]|uniref:helix-turn-helix transcriptional regulator n=1 Tax=Streptomyces sp. NPDC048172 TaxID=3365505 RepID=UPI00371921F8
MTQTGNRSDGGSPTTHELARLLTSWRKRLDPRRIQGVDNSRRRLSSGLTQQEVATLTGVSETWYRALERGVKHHQFSEGFLQRLAMTLRLDEAERALLFQLAIGRTPEPVRLAQSECANEATQTLLDHQLPHPAYLSNLHWDIVAHNQSLKDWFPWIPYEPNVMRCIFLYPEARECMVNWRDEWARPFLSQLRFALAMHPDSEGLIQIRDDILAGNEDAREMWEEVWEKESPLPHAYGDVRRLLLPYHQGEEVAVHIYLLSPMLNPDMRFVVLWQL